MSCLQEEKCKRYQQLQTNQLVVQCIKNPRKNPRKNIFLFGTALSFLPTAIWFQKNHGTIHALSFLIYNITESLANKTLTLGVFLDLSKTFDTIDHSILLSKLKHSRIRGIALDWIKSYLTGRTQKVECSGILSNSITPVKRGIPHRSTSFSY